MIPFKVIHNDNTKVILEITPLNPIDVAMYPYLNSEYKYITISKGKSHMLTVVKTNGTNFHFWWGEGGHTLISQTLQELKRVVLDYLQSQYIWIEWTKTTLPTEISILYNSYFKKWELIADNVCWFSPTATSWEDVSHEVEKLLPNLKVSTWVKTVAQTGITIWKGVIG